MESQYHQVLNLKNKGLMKQKLQKLYSFEKVKDQILPQSLLKLLEIFIT